MKLRSILSLTLLYALCACSSSDDDTRDMTNPVITGEGIVANPIDCQVYKRGQTIDFNYVFTDNMELGNYNIEIHNNFDHHTHGTSAIDCPLEPEMSKEALSNLHKQHPDTLWVYNQDFTIPNGLRSYNAKVEIPIPADKHPGDYHFMIRLTDKAGRQELKALAIKITE